jgi:hypothetical protein
MWKTGLSLLLLLGLANGARISHLSQTGHSDWDALAPRPVKAAVKWFHTLGDSVVPDIIEEGDDGASDGAQNAPTRANLDGHFCAGDLPICGLDAAQSIQHLGYLDSVAVLRKKAVLFVGSDLAYGLYDRAVHVLTNGEEKPNPKYAVQRLGSSRVGYQKLTAAETGNLEWYITKGSFSNDISTNPDNGKRNYDAVVAMLTPEVVTLDKLEQFSTALRHAQTEVFVIVPKFGENNEHCDEEMDNLHDKVIQVFSKASSSARVVFLGRNVVLADSTSCSFKPAFNDAVVSSLFSTFNVIWPQKTLSGDTMGMIIFFAPIFLLALIMESNILVRLQSSRSTVYKPVAAERSSPRELESLTESKAKVDPEVANHGHPVADVEKNLTPDVKVVPVSGNGKVDQLLMWYWKEDGRKVVMSFCVYGIVMLLCYLATFQGKMLSIQYGSKPHSLDAYYACLVLLLLAGVYTLHKSKPEEEGKPLAILNRDQTEEWKGIMQVSFILYHYFHTEEVYNLIRIYIACYVWMTGYGNFFFFSNTRDFSLARVAKMVLRMNLFVLFLCFTMSTEYMLYYICCLHTFYFFVVYLTMLPVKLAKKEDTKSQTLIVGGSLLASFIILTVLFEVEAVFKFVFGAFPWFYLEGSIYEWWFRARLDHYATWFGMCVAFLLPRWTQLQSWIDHDKNVLARRVKRGVFVGTLSLFLYWYLQAVVLKLNKFDYNAQHPYTSVIPIILYILIRNSSSWLRTRNLGIPAWLGKITLETYLLQFHLWLTDDAKTVIVIVEKYPTVNFIIITAVYLIAAYASFLATSHIIDFILPAKSSNMVTFKRTLGFFGVIWGVYLFGVLTTASA